MPASSARGSMRRAHRTVRPSAAPEADAAARGTTPARERRSPRLARRCPPHAYDARAPSRPPSSSPAASDTALTAPALVALIQAMSRPSSCSRRSSAPNVNAPCAPPPSSARLRPCRRRTLLKRVLSLSEIGVRPFAPISCRRDAGAKGLTPKNARHHGSTSMGSTTGTPSML